MNKFIRLTNTQSQVFTNFVFNDFAQKPHQVCVHICTRNAIVVKAQESESFNNVGKHKLNLNLLPKFIKSISSPEKNIHFVITASSSSWNKLLSLSYTLMLISLDFFYVLCNNFLKPLVAYVYVTFLFARWRTTNEFLIFFWLYISHSLTLALFFHC